LESFYTFFFKAITKTQAQDETRIEELIKNIQETQMKSENISKNIEIKENELGKLNDELTKFKYNSPAI
jgi:predicted DNA-binding ribbon-helix-helix protein